MPLNRPMELKEIKSFIEDKEKQISALSKNLNLSA